LNVKLLQKTKFQTNCYIFQKFIEYFTGKNFDILSLPRLSGVDCFLYPELHEESVMLITTHRVLQKVFFSAGIKNFSLSDYYTKNCERFQKIVSGIINLARFREDLVKILNKFSEKLFLLSSFINQITFNVINRTYQVFVIKHVLTVLLSIVRTNFTEHLTSHLTDFLTRNLINDIQKLVKDNKKYFEDFEKKKVVFTRCFNSVNSRKKLVYYGDRDNFLDLEIQQRHLKKFYQLCEVFYDTGHIILYFLLNIKELYPGGLRILLFIYKRGLYLISLEKWSIFLTKKFFNVKRINLSFMDQKYNLLARKKNATVILKIKPNKAKKIFFLIKIFYSLL